MYVQPDGRWQAQVYFDNKNIYLKSSSSDMKAAQMRDAAVLHLGSKAVLNFPDRDYSKQVR